MGCKPSSSHRQIGLRHEPFHNSVFPVTPGGADEGTVWATPVFRNDYGHPVDLSAFLSLPPPVHVPQEDPPPYSEQLLDGHVTLMHGGERGGHKDDTIDQDANDTLLSVRDVSNVLDNSTQSIGCSRNYQREDHPLIIADETSRGRDAEALNTDETHGSPLSRLPTLGDASHFTDSPSQVLMPPAFRRTYRSTSIDNSDMFPDDAHREQRDANVARPLLFPPRLTPISNNTTHALPFLQGASPTQSFPGPRLLRLPPLLGNSAQEMPNLHRRRNKRKRGHSWHGEAIDITSGERFAVSPTVMTTVAE